MEKTTVYLTTEQKAALARAAQVEGRSEARLIRAGIEAVTARHRSAEAVNAIGDGEVAGSLPDRLEPGARPRWMGRDEFARRVVRHQADAGLRAELRALAPDSTDDVPTR